MKFVKLQIGALFWICVIGAARADESALLHQVCMPGAMVSGTDVSDHQTSTQWGTIKHAGIGFAFVKATEGINFKNVDFDRDWPQAKSAGILRGGYHYFHPGDDPIQQASFYLSTVGRIEAGDLPPMLDWEVTDGIRSDLIVERAKIWLERVERATGKTPIIYTDPAYWRKLLSPSGFEKYPLFIADYVNKCPDVPAPWSTWTFWQKGVGSLTGISGFADLDSFDGNLTALQAFANPSYTLGGSSPTSVKSLFDPRHFPQPEGDFAGSEAFSQ